MRKQFICSALIIALLAIIAPSFQAVQAAPALVADPVLGDLDPAFAGFKFIGPTFTSITKDIALLPNGKTVVLAASDKPNEFILFRYQSNGQRDLFNVSDNAGYKRFPGTFAPKALAIQSDGNMIVASRFFHLMRITPLGAIDTSFGQNGIVRDSDAVGQTAAVLVQPDGKIVTAGRNGDNFAVTRYNNDGSRDSSFGGGSGTVRVAFGRGAFVNDMALQSDGKLVVVGWSNSGYSFRDADFAVMRLNSNGTLDSSFDYDGKLSTGFGDDEGAYSVAIQPDNKIVVIGATGSGKKTFLARYYPDGRYDGDFGSQGQLTIPVDELKELVTLPDNRLLLIGTHTSPDGTNNFAVYRLKPDGALDTTFDYDGIAWLDFYNRNDQGTNVALLPDGRILVAGTSDNLLELARLWPDGTTFDSGGQQTHSLALPPYYRPGQRESTNAMVLQSNGYMFVAGQVYDPQGNFSDAFVQRFTPDGKPEMTWGNNGSVRLSLGRFTVATAIALQSDGKVVIAGYSAFDLEQKVTDIMVARFNPNGTRDTTFGNNGTVLEDFNGGADGAAAIALAPDGKIVVVGTVWNGMFNDWGVLRLTTNGQRDNAFLGNGGFSLGITQQNGLTSVAVQPDKKIVLGGMIDKNFAVARLQENGLVDASFGIDGFTITDLGGVDVIRGVALAPNGWIYAAGFRVQNGNGDMALAQYTPTGKLASCDPNMACANWPNGTFFFDAGINDYAYAVDVRSDNQVVAAGCSNQHVAGMQLHTDGAPTPLLFNTNFVGLPDCATAVKFVDGNKVVMAGDQDSYPFANDGNIALARFVTTPTARPSVAPTNQEPTPDAERDVENVTRLDGDTTNDAEMDTKPDENTINDMDATVFQP